MYPNCISLVTSTISPIKKGKIAPPTIDMISQDDPDLVSSPSPNIPKENIVGNIIDMNKPNPPREYNTIIPEPDTAIKESKIAAAAHIVNICLAVIYFKKKVPIKRPIINKNP